MSVDGVDWKPMGSVVLRAEQEVLMVQIPFGSPAVEVVQL